MTESNILAAIDALTQCPGCGGDITQDASVLYGRCYGCIRQPVFVEQTSAVGQDPRRTSPLDSAAADVLSHHARSADDGFDGSRLLSEPVYVVPGGIVLDEWQEQTVRRLTAETVTFSRVSEDAGQAVVTLSVNTGKLTKAIAKLLAACQVDVGQKRREMHRSYRQRQLARRRKGRR